jgi:hypothetical protein
MRKFAQSGHLVFRVCLFSRLQKDPGTTYSLIDFLIYLLPPIIFSKNKSHERILI